MKIGFVSLGCPKNLVDAEVMLGLAEAAGHRITSDAEGADVLVVNTCAFIDRAKQESIDTILEMAAAETSSAPGRRLVVTGCLAERYRDELQRTRSRRSMRCSAPARSPTILDALAGDASPTPVARRRSHFLPGSEAAHLPSHSRVSASTFPTYLYDADTPRRLATPDHYAYVKIAEGCDYKCAFCIIPKMRGHYRSRTDRVDHERSASARGSGRQGAAADLAGHHASSASIARSAARCRGCCAS